MCIRDSTKFQGKAADAPMCMTCGTKMRPAGSCYVCEAVSYTHLRAHETKANLVCRPRLLRWRL